MNRNDLLLPLLLLALAPISEDTKMAPIADPARRAIPRIDQAAPQDVRTATFALG